MRRIGIMGGTFDPIHYGHLVAAEMARTEFVLDKVLFVPNGISPHKLTRRVTPAEIRYLMVKLAIKGNSEFWLSSIEIEREGPSYTLDTLKEIQSIYPDSELYFITGTDALCEIFDWHKPEEIMKRTRFIAATRPGYDAQGFLLRVKLEYPHFMDKIHLLEVPSLAISSTDIRQRVSQGQSIRYLLPEEVHGFIRGEELYLNDDN